MNVHTPCELVYCEKIYVYLFVFVLVSLEYYLIIVFRNVKTKASKAYRWPEDGEFTRLAAGPVKPDRAFEFERLVIWMEPMRSKYKTFMDFQRIMFGVLEDEYFMMSEAHRNQYTTTGTVMASVFIESILVNNRFLNSYVITVRINADQFWNVDTHRAVKEIHIPEFSIRDDTDVRYNSFNF